ncbi:glycosyltransferase family 2 protein [Sphingomonas sp. R86520]|uniref:glycosyltransferase family 2 protein n=1 Tax=Sphingomonas sp. R86520 TaxID=3093859 RepID=UPI0036D3D5B9
MPDGTIEEPAAAAGSPAHQRRPGRFFVVINHYQGAKPPAYLVQSTLFSASLAIAATSVGAVVVVDGSAEPNGKLKTALAELGIGYYHAGRRLSFAEGYNSGLALSDRPWTIFCASDIYPSATVFSALDGFCADAGPEVGCVVPLLSAGDLNLQRVGGTFRKAIQVPLMTLNFNAFPTDYLNAIGGVPEEFKGNYNDVVLTRRMQLDKRSIWQIPARCVHFGSLTLNSGGSTVSFTGDAEKFRSTYPELYRAGGLWDLRVEAFSRSFVFRAIASVSRLVPRRFRWSVEDKLLAIWAATKMR